MNNIYKFCKRPLKYGEKEQFILEKLQEVVTGVDSIIKNICEGYKYKILFSYIVKRHKLVDRVEILTNELKKAKTDLGVDPRIFIELKKKFVGSAQSLDGCLDKIGKAFILRLLSEAQHAIMKEVVDPLGKYLEETSEEEQTRENQLKSLAMVSKKFLQYNGSEVSFCGGDFGKGLIASRILEILDIDKKTRECFYLEVNSEVVIQAADEAATFLPDETPVEERRAKRIKISVNNVK